jgi:hypothetical protein
MPDNDAGAETQSIKQNEWTITHPAFRYLTRHEPPRPFGLLFPLRYELRDRLVLQIWTIGLVSFVAGIVLRQWPLILIGPIAFVGWLWLYSRLALAFRSGPLLIGVVDSLATHPGRSEFAIANAGLSDGKTIPVVVLRSLVAGLIDQAGRVEVVFLHSPRAEYSSVLGVRPIRPQKDPTTPDSMPIAPYNPAENPS